MTLLRMQNRTPPIYCEESRDFQLFCRLYDTIVNGLLFDIDTITDLINTKDIRSSFLQLLQTKLGFFTPYSFNENTLRYVLSGFPHMVKYKGSLKSIEYAVNNFLKINNILSPVTVTYQKTPLLLQNGYTVPDHTIVVGISASLQEATILKEVFRYILPFGTGYYFYYYSTRSELTNILEADNAIILYISDNINAVLRSAIPEDLEEHPENYIDFMDAGFVKSEKSNNEIKGTNEMKRLIGGIDTINLITNTFGELGDLIYTNSNETGLVRNVSVPVLSTASGSDISSINNININARNVDYLFLPYDSTYGYGFTSIDFYNSGKNIYDISIGADNFSNSGSATHLNDNGVLVINSSNSSANSGVEASYTRSHIVRILSNLRCKKTISCTISSNVDNTSVKFNSSANIINVGTTPQRFSITLSSKSSNFYLYAVNTEAIIRVYDFQIEIGDSATSYEAYSGNQSSVNWSSSNIVYDGVLDVQQGKITTSYAQKILNKLSWTYKVQQENPTTGHTIGYFVSTTLSNSANTAYDEIPDIKAIDIGYVKSSPFNIINDRNTTNRISLYNKKIIIRDNSYTLSDYESESDMITDFESRLSRESVVYPLESPKTFDVTVNNIPILQNQNNLFTNSGGNIEATIYTGQYAGDNLFEQGYDIQFLGVHYSDNSLSEYISDNFDTSTFVTNRTIIVFNEEEYLYVSDDWQKLKLLHNVKNFEDVEDPDSYNIVYKDASTVYEDSNNTIDGVSYDDPNKGYYIYNGSTWEICTYPIYVIGQDATAYDAYTEPLEEE